MRTIKYAFALALMATVTLVAAERRHRSPREVVTHKICFIDDAGNKTCE